MRSDATFIGIEIADEIAGDADVAQKLEDACPVDIYANSGGRVEIVEKNVDECILCELCLRVSPPGTVKVHKLYSGETLAGA